MAITLKDHLLFFAEKLTTPFLLSENRNGLTGTGLSSSVRTLKGTLKVNVVVKYAIKK